MPPDLTVGEDWAAQLTDLANRLRTAMLRHRDGARLVATYAPGSPRSRHMTEAWLRSILASGLPLPAVAYAWDTLMSYVTGFVLQEQATPAAPDADRPTPTTAEQFAEFPTLARWAAMKPSTKDDAFVASVAFIVAGIQARLSESA